MKSAGQKASVDELELDRERLHLQSIRRVITNFGAVLGVSPFLHAIAPNFLPTLVAGLRAVWAAVVCTLVAVSAQELFLWREQRRGVRRTTRDDRP